METDTPHKRSKCKLTVDLMHESVNDHCQAIHKRSGTDDLSKWSDSKITETNHQKNNSLGMLHNHKVTSLLLQCRYDAARCHSVYRGLLSDFVHNSEGGFPYRRSARNTITNEATPGHHAFEDHRHLRQRILTSLANRDYRTVGEMPAMVMLSCTITLRLAVSTSSTPSCNEKRILGFHN